MKKVIAVLVAVMLLLSLVPTTAFALDPVSYASLNYSTQLTLGEASTGTIAFDPFAYVETQYGGGCAKGFNVQLEANTEYMFNLLVTTETPVTHGITLVVLRNSLSGMYLSFNGNNLTPNVHVGVTGTKAGTSVRFTPEQAGQYKVLIIERSLMDNHFAKATYSLTAGKIEWKNYNISTSAELADFRNRVNAFEIPTANANVKLTDNIDLSTAPLAPIGFFAGTFDGNSKTMTGGTMYLPDVDHVGIFGTVFGNAVLKNVAIENLTVTGRCAVGALAATITDTEISGCKVAGRVTGASQVGGLVGEAHNYIVFKDCSSSAAVSGGSSQTGGLIGALGNNATVDSCTASGAVNGALATGGLIGSANITVDIKNSSATGNVAGADNSGGFIGSAGSVVAITKCEASGTVKGANDVGGFIGSSDVNTVIMQCKANGAVTGSTNVGGFAGDAIVKSTYDMCTAQGAVKGNNAVGGFAGIIESANIIKNCYAKGAVSNNNVWTTLLKNSAYGGFAGLVSTIDILSTAVNKIENCYTISSLNVTANAVGGFIGSIELAGRVNVLNCYASNSVTIAKIVENYGSYLGKYGPNDRYPSTFTKCYVDTLPALTVQDTAVAPKPLCLNALAARVTFEVTEVAFNDGEAVDSMTKALNEYAGTDETLIGWGGLNAAGGPELQFPAPDTGDSFEDVLDWVRSQNIIFQIPLWIFYVPIQFIIKTVRGWF